MTNEDPSETPITEGFGSEHENIENEEPTDVLPPLAPACPHLEQLYGLAAFESRELVPGLTISPIIFSCQPDQPVNVRHKHLNSCKRARGKSDTMQELIQQSWKPELSEDAENTIPAFDPTSKEYEILPRRLAKSKALIEVNRLKIVVKDKEEELQSIHGKKGVDEEREALQAQLDEVKAQLDEAQNSFAELKSTFYDDLQSMVPWMNVLFASTDLGISTLTVSPGSLVPGSIKQSFSKRHGVEGTEGVEKLLLAFKNRYTLERGADAAPRLIFRFSPNIFRGKVSDELVTGEVARMLEAAGNDPDSETPRPLDCLELCWWDSEYADPIPTLRLLSSMCKDETTIDEETGEVTVVSGKKIQALGISGLSAKDLEQVVAAGVSLSFVRVSCGFHNHSTVKPLLDVCKKYCLKVLGDDCLMCGLVSDYFVGMPPPKPTQSDLPVSPAMIPHACALVDELGGWSSFQQVLQTLFTISQRHNVTIQTVALRWCIEQGVTPIVPLSWKNPCEPFGKQGGHGVLPDGLLFQRSSFLDHADLAALNGACA